MAYTLERTSNTGLTIAVRAPYQELEPLFGAAAKRISEAEDIEGFRRGKAPYETIRQKFGEFKILEEAAGMYIRANFETILKEVRAEEFKNSSFEPVGEPQITITKLAPGEEFRFKIALTLLPAIELPDYRAIARRVLATRRVPQTAEQEVSDAIGWLRESRAKIVTVNREAREGDRVEIDFNAAASGAPLNGGASENHPLILGRGRFPPGFESALIGMKAGQERTFSLAVPPDWRDKALAGRNVEFTAKMKLIQEREVPAFDDGFAKSLGNFGSTAAVEKNIRDGLTIEKEEKERERLRMAMAQEIADEAKAEIPDALIGRELDKMAAELKDSIVGMGLTFEDYLTHIKQTAESIRREWRSDAERRVKIALMLSEIAQREGIAPAEAEIQEAMRRTAAHRGLDAKDIATLDREAFIRYHVGVARNEKVFRWLESLGS
ncbi:MAG: trigger factor [Candidatus Sungbacteria bacterium]|uniref:Trigger factor n=1 Tax=Candidatus Sungiibacteriota bacterium TaxID=2750080 RepID=A0A932YYP5_9BACT|nr:trigger factor [Candidatus Sungbacteria bacterium]